MKKKTSNKKPRNKWKIVAIISLVVNALVVLLLTIGLATPKAKYLSVNAYNSNYGDYDIYEQTPYLHKFNSLDNSYSVFSDLVSNDLYTITRPSDNVERKYLNILFTDKPLKVDPYLNVGVPYVRAIHCWFKGIHDPTLKPDTTFLLDRLYVYPYNDSDYYLSINASWTYQSNLSSNALVDYSCTFQNLGFDSSYAMFPNGSSALNTHLSRMFYNRGSNAIIEDLLINGNFNPNKYMSLTMDSIGLLYEAPLDYGSNVTWSAPMYRGSVNGRKVSTLGFLEIPFLFTSNNENFLGIRLYFDVVQSYVGTDNEVHYIEYGNDPITLKYHYTFVYMSYYYEPHTALGTIPYNIKEKVVCAVPVYTTTTDYIDNGVQYRNYTYEPFKAYNWLSQEYKKIGVYGASQEQLNSVGISYPLNFRSLAINNLTIREILLYDMSINPGNINTGGGNIGNVFSLIRLAFDSLTGVLAISIVPGLSIGILLFLPLVLTIIIVIIKLVKR